MLHLRRHRRLLCWVTLFTLVLCALAPGLARAWASDQGAPWSAVCSSAGNDRDVAPADNHAGNGLVHCLYCAMQGDQLALPPTQPPGVPAPALVFAVPPLLCLAPYRQHAWAAAQARAPPPAT